ncbi:TylF/MycF/NovP-related O-methyltransferase [Rhodohalobacter sp. 8-1]|uniref:TylF/MycF/NovP-related O-methyltransferase n=1 Tax=Rhodohalobacter sp. 8-1 TaxID=3131972 RepID=UPI0030ECE87D
MSETFFGFETEKMWDYENGFYLTSPAKRIPKMLAQYELYKSIIHLPGHVVECGVYKGASLIRLATFREVLESPYSRKIIGFDAFGEFPKQKKKEDAEFIEEFEDTAGYGIPEDELKEVFRRKAFENYEFIKGDIIETVPDYLQDHPELKISFLHVDVDVYKPTKVILDHLYDRIVRGGVIVFDDYGTVAGETEAVDEFFEEKDILIEKPSISHIPSFIRKNK